MWKCGIFYLDIAPLPSSFYSCTVKQDDGTFLILGQDVSCLKVAIQRVIEQLSLAELLGLYLSVQIQATALQRQPNEIQALPSANIGQEERNMSMNEFQVFENSTFGQVRTVTKNGEPWFVAADVCRALEHSNVSMALERLDEDERAKFNLGHPYGEANIVNEPGLYTLVLGSRKPEAKAFKRWITHEVIPSIRQHGGYLTPAKIEEALLDPDTIIQLATQLKQERQKRAAIESKLVVKDQLIGELKPKADYVDLILQNPGVVAITQIAKDYGMSGSQMNRTLHALQIQFKQSGQWLLYREYHGQGYTHSETVQFTRHDGAADVKMITKWTQKGRLFIYNMLKDKCGILPIIEQDRIA